LLGLLGHLRDDVESNDRLQFGQRGAESHE
jgi:hypothetical protein